MDHNILCRIRDINKAVAEYENMTVKKYGLSLNEGMLLCCLSQGGTMSSTEIAKALGLTCSNTSKVLKTVEAKKMVKRDLSEHDKRSMLFSITQTGQSTMENLLADTADIPELLGRILNL
jgi:DNA-binding MarR family transcriptional regulator